MTERRHLTQAEIEERLAKRAEEVLKEVKGLERAAIKTQKTGLLSFNTPGQHGVVHSGK